MTDKQTNSSKPAGSKTLQVLDVIRSIELDSSDRDLIALGMFKDLRIRDTVVEFTLVIPPGIAVIPEEIEEVIAERLNELGWVTEMAMALRDETKTTAQIPAGAGAPPAAPQAATAPAAADGHRPLNVGGEARPDGENPIPGVKHVIAVGSGKGGVGKSTVSVNLALALVALGYKVGLLDVDVYGPSIPLMLGVDGHPLISEAQKLIPNEKFGLKVMSMGFLLKPNQAVVWRGPMVHGVVKQFLQDVDWGELDFLIVDLPPGTGDAPLSLTQSLPLTATVLVTTPQEVAASVAAKAMTMFERMGIRTLGVIENMSYFICPSCQTASDIFDRGGGKLLASDAGVPFLGDIPLDMRMRKGGDVGEPLMTQFPESELAERFREIARRLASVLGEKANARQS
jgi:ATP-binding protein involved in chromosome partitioning